MISRKINKKIKIKDLFVELGVNEEENSSVNVNFPLKVKTPYGYKQIKTAFRTEKQSPTTLYFRNNKTLTTSPDHRLMVNGEWKRVKDISSDDIIETETGTTSILPNRGRKIKSKEEILYDISVEDVHCYYSNGILSHNSWTLSRIGSNSIKQGKNVVHITLELQQKYTGFRYDSCFTGISFQKVKDHPDKIRKIMGDIKSKLNIKYFPMYSISSADIKLYLERYMTLKQERVDLLIVDYADLLRPEIRGRNSDPYEEGGSVYGGLRSIAGELQIPIWTCSQGNRSSYTQDIVGAESVADSFKKIMIGDFVASLARKREDKMHSVARIHIVKNRFGPDGMTFPAKFDTDCGHLELFDSKSREGMEIQNKMGETDNSVKNLIKSKWNRNRSTEEEEE